MVEINTNELTDAEAEQYDRQIRLWGLDSQKRLDSYDSFGVCLDVLTNLRQPSTIPRFFIFICSCAICFDVIHIPNEAILLVGSNSVITWC